jgi:hypothetical protein
MASGETSRSQIPGGQPGRSGEVARSLDPERRISHDASAAKPAGTILRNSGEVARRLGRISHNGSPGNAAVAMAFVVQRGALNRARAADHGAGG